METLKIGDDAWHRRFIDFAGQTDRLLDLHYSDTLDTCSYRSVFIRSFFIVCFALIVAAFFGVTFGYDVAVFGYHAYLGHFLTPDELMLMLKEEFPPAIGFTMEMFSFLIFIIIWLLIVFVIALLVTIMYKGVQKLFPAKPVKKGTSSTNVLVASWKEKFCKKVELE